MFIVQFGGGLGNQLFQFAFSFFLRSKYPNVPIKYDVSNYKLINEHNGFDLPQYFEFKEDLVSNEVLKVVKSGCYYVSKFGIFKKNEKLRNKTIHLIDKCSRKIKKGRKVEYQIVRDSPTSSYNRGISKLDIEIEKIWFFQGNWQNILYYKDIQKLLLDKIRFKVNLTKEESVIAKKIQETNSVCIHIRRGDYVGTRFDLCSQEYYRCAIDELNKIKKNNYTYFVFSDDLNYAEQMLHYVKDKELVKSSSCGTDMFLMTQCKNYILANSTFSFWGAFLSKTLEKIVIVPKYAYKFQDMYYEFSVPDDWVKLDNL